MVAAAAAAAVCSLDLAMDTGERRDRTRVSATEQLTVAQAQLTNKETAAAEIDHILVAWPRPRDPPILLFPQMSHKRRSHLTDSQLR